MSDMTDPTRTPCIIEKVSTPFGSMYVQVDVDPDGRLRGGSIASPGKEPDSRVHQLVRALSGGLDRALKMAGEANG